MNKHIEEMARDLKQVQDYGAVIIENQMDCRYSSLRETKNQDVAKHLYDKGYRKSTDVARELGELIKDEIYMTLREYCNMDAICLIDERIDEAVKKYESEGKNNG